MQKGKRIFYVLATLLAILPIASCKMDGGDIKAASIEAIEEKPKGSTLIIRTNVSTQEQTATNARSAVPSQLLDTDGNSLVFAGALYANGTQENNKKFQKGEYNNGKLTLTFESSEEDRNDYTLEIRAYKGGTEDFDDKHLLSGTALITIEANKTEINAPAIKLKPYEGAIASGNINLEILIPSEYSLSIEMEGEAFILTEKTTDQAGYKKYTISADGLEAGIHEADFFLQTSMGIDVYLWSEAINVYPGMTTDQWNTGIIKDGARQINKASIFSTFYVMGASPSSKWFKDRSVSDTEENGSLSHPFTKIQDAIDKVLAINDGSTPFLIYIDGTLTQSEAPSNGMADFSALEQDLTLTIKSLSETTKATLDANKKSRVMYASSNTGKLINLTLENLVITNGSTSNNGGGIYFDGSDSTFTMKGCSITGSKATNGGGVYFNGGTLEIKGYALDDETANDSEIKSNTATSVGGGIYITGSKKANISGTTISGNTANVDGGGVYVTGCELTMNGTITGNTAQQGGGVYVTGNNGVFTMTGGEITGNHTTTDSANGNENGIAGGGIFIYSGGQANISNTTIFKNTANNNGGGIHVNGGTLTLNAGAIIRRNEAVNNGGGVYNFGGTFTMTGGTIGGDNDTIDDKNTAKNGGGVYIYNGTFKMDGGTISKNEATGNAADSSGNGGGVYIIGNSSEFKMIKGTITGNTASENGGGVYYDNGTFEMSGGSISTNYAEYGGGVYVSLDPDEFKMTGGEITGNSADQDGGGVYVNGGTFTLDGGKINGGNTAKYGGGVYIWSADTFTMKNGEISGNKAEGEDSSGGGGVNVNNGTFEMKGGTISKNEATGSNFGGGGVYVHTGQTFTMSGTAKISGNKATKGKGGGVYSEGGTFTMNSGTIGGDTTDDKNTAYYGGGVYVKSGTFKMRDSEISGNEAIESTNASSGKGAGVYVDGAKFEMSGTAKICRNKGANDGSGVCVTGVGVTSKFTMNNGSICNNETSSSYGGGVYIAQNNEFEMNNDSTISENFAPDGGGVYVAGLFTMNDGTISNNGTSSNNNAYSNRGGGVCVYGEFIMNKGKIIDNTAKTQGGGIYLTYDGIVNSAGGKFTMNGGTFSGNKTTETNESKGAYNNGTFTMGGNAKFDENNDIYLVNSNKIHIKDNLTSATPVATITPYKYESGRQVLSADNETTMQNNYNKFAVTSDNGTKWKVVQGTDTNTKYGVLKKDNVSPDDGSGGISVTIPGVGSYTFKFEAGSTEILEGSQLSSGTSIKFSEVKDSSGKALTSSDGTFSIEIRDESGNPLPNASATGFQCAATVPQVPTTGMKMQIYAKVVLNSGIVIDKTISVTGPKPPEPQS